MPDPFRPAFEGLQELAENLVRANQALVKSVDAVLAAKDEHEDPRETVVRLEGLVVQQTREVHAVRAELTEARAQWRDLRERLNGKAPSDS
jgi:predicted  nucleic acid-binding Zn-ribbon protein